MLIASVSDFRNNIKSYLDLVSKNFETLIINRGSNSGVVIMSLQEYNSIMNTQKELSSAKNEKRLDSAVDKLKTKNNSVKNDFKTIEIDRINLSIMGVKFPSLKTLESTANAIGSNMFEGFIPTPKGIEIIRDYVIGKISLVDVMKFAKKKAYV